MRSGRFRARRVDNWYVIVNEKDEILARRKSKDKAKEVLQTFAQADWDARGLSFGQGVDD